MYRNYPKPEFTLADSRHAPNGCTDTDRRMLWAMFSVLYAPMTTKLTRQSRCFVTGGFRSTQILPRAPEPWSLPNRLLPTKPVCRTALEFRHR